MFDRRKESAHAFDDRQRITLRRRLHADENRVLAAERDAGVSALRAELDGCDVLDADEAAVLGLHDHPLEITHVGQVGIGRDVGDGVVTLYLPRRGLKIISLDRSDDVGGGDAAARHPHRIEPQPHRESLAAENVGRGDAVDRRHERLDDARQIVGDRRAAEFIAGEPDIHHRRSLAGRFQDDRIVGRFRDLIFDLVDLRHYVGQRLVGIGVELHVDLYRARPLHRRRGHVIDALGRGDRLFDRSRDEALHQFRRSAGIGRRHGDDRVRKFRILPNRQAGAGLEPYQQDQTG